MRTFKFLLISIFLPLLIISCDDIIDSDENINITLDSYGDTEKILDLGEIEIKRVGGGRDHNRLKNNTDTIVNISSIYITGKNVDIFGLIAGSVPNDTIESYILPHRSSEVGITVYSETLGPKKATLVYRVGDKEYKTTLRCYIIPRRVDQLIREYDFGLIEVGQTAEHYFQDIIVNMSNGIIRVDSLWMSPNDITYHVSTKINFPIFLTPGDGFSLTAVAHPKSTGHKEDYIMYKTCTETFGLRLESTAYPHDGKLTVKDTIIDFGTVGFAQIKQEFIMDILVNNSAESVEVQSVEIVKGDMTSFTIDGLRKYSTPAVCPVVLDYGGRLSLYLRVKPDNYGVYSNGILSATLLIKTSAGDFEFELSCRVSQWTGKLKVTGDTINIGTVPDGVRTGIELRDFFINTSDEAVTIESAEFMGGDIEVFEITDKEILPIEILPGNRMSMTFYAIPPVVGTKEAVVLIKTSADDFKITLICNGP